MQARYWNDNFDPLHFSIKFTSYPSEQRNFFW